MEQTSKQVNDYENVRDFKLREFLIKNPIDAYFDMDDNPMGF